MPPQWQVAFQTLRQIAEGEILALFAAIWGLVFYQMLIGRINLSGLLADSTGSISPVRLQLLLGTLGVAGACVAGLTGFVAPGHDHAAPFDPAVSGTVAGSVAGGANLLYLVRKYLYPDRQNPAPQEA